MIEGHEHLDALRRRFSDERGTYERLGSTVDRLICAEAVARGVTCSVTHRTKEVDSFVKKAMRKTYQDPWAEIQDKAGVRVVTPYEADVAQLEDVICGLFDVAEREDKAKHLNPAELDYLGIHYIVSLRAADRADSDLRGKVCEVQLHTHAQNLWALVAHGLIYKAPQEVPSDVSRSIYRLMALLELFDAEVTRGREAIFVQDGYREAVMLVESERQFLKLTARHSDPVLSRKIVEQIRPLYSEQEAQAFPKVLSAFVAGNREKLEAVFRNYLEDDRVPLIGQPEILLIFERLDHDKFNLAERWAQTLAPSLLEKVAAIWGTPLEE